MTTPLTEVDITGTGKNAVVRFQRAGGAIGKFTARPNEMFIGTANDKPIVLLVNNTQIMTVNSDGTLAMSDGGSYNGTWNPASSKEYKENVKTLTTEEALEAFNELSPVKYNYKTHKEEERVGFIAEEVPDLVAMNGRKNLSTMDIVAVLTKVTQEQQKVIHEQQKALIELSGEVKALKKEMRLRGSVALAGIE